MSESRGWLDRLLARFKPRQDPDLTPPPEQLAPGLFAIERRLRLPGGVMLPNRFVALVFADGGLVLIAPPPLDGATREALAALGTLRALVAPNSFHYLYVEPWVATFPAVELHLAPGLAERRRELPPGRTLANQPPPLWAGEMDQAVYGPARGVSEVAFLHRATGSLLLTDSVFNLRGEMDRRSRLAWRAYGAWEKFGPSISAKRILLNDAAAAAAFAERVLAWAFERIVMAHGEVVGSGGHGLLEAAFADWLGSGSSLSIPAPE